MGMGQLAPFVFVPALQCNAGETVAARANGVELRVGNGFDHVRLPLDDETLPGGFLGREALGVSQIAHQCGKLVFGNFDPVPNSHSDDGHFPAFGCFSIVADARKPATRARGMTTGAPFLHNISGI